MIRTYSELLTYKSFEDRFNYLKLEGKIGEDTFGHDRFLNQILYHTKEWKDLRDFVIVRDNGCDLACENYEIHSGLLIHHMNAITKKDILQRSRIVFDPEYLITTCLRTHNAIHYGDSSLLEEIKPIIRSKNDTCPWRL